MSRVLQFVLNTPLSKSLLPRISTTSKSQQSYPYATMAVKINKISVHKVQVPKSKIDFGAEIRGADLENLSGKSTSVSSTYTEANYIVL
jgi:hypothetical protein